MSAKFAENIKITQNSDKELAKIFQKILANIRKNGQKCAYCQIDEKTYETK